MNPGDYKKNRLIEVDRPLTIDATRKENTKNTGFWVPRFHGSAYNQSTYQGNQYCCRYQAVEEVNPVRPLFLQPTQLKMLPFSANMAFWSENANSPD
jgi:hypothetical protein